MRNTGTRSFPVFRVMSLYFAFLISMALPAFAQPLEIQGKIVNGTLQAEGKAEQVTLLSLGQGMQEVSTLKDVQGSFKFPVADDKAGPFLLRATYQGVNYFKTIGPFQAHDTAQHEILVYEPVDTLEKAEIRLPHLFIKREQDQLAFVWNFEINNPTKNTMYRSGGLFPLNVPDNVASLNVSASSSEMPVRVILTKDPKTGSFLVNYPLKPGKTKIELSYSVDYAKENYVLQQHVLYPLSKVVALIYPEDLKVESEGLKELQVDAANHVKIAGWDGLQAGSLWSMQIQGGSKIAAAESQQQQQDQDREVVERNPDIAKAKLILWALMGLGLGLNLVLFLRHAQRRARPSFEFSALTTTREKLAQLEAQRKDKSFDEKNFRSRQKALVKEAWNAYLEETHGN